MFDEMKTALRKYIGNQCLEEKNLQIKQEIMETSSFENDESEAFIKGSRNNHRGRRPYRGYSDMSFRSTYRGG